MSDKRFNSTKQIIKNNKNLGTAINNKRYTLNDANDLVNKIAKKKISKNKAINVYSNLVKVEQISDSAQTKSVRNIKLFGRNF